MFRTIGHRKIGEHNPPLMHAKLALLGNLWWHDEGPLGHAQDVSGFTAQRLWISSANFTQASRLHLEFGYWTEDPGLVRGAEKFILRLIAASEDFDSEFDTPAPEFVERDFDNDAIADAAADFPSSEPDEYY